jgi:hypothetical protein
LPALFGRRMHTITQHGKPCIAGRLLGLVLDVWPAGRRLAIASLERSQEPHTSECAPERGRSVLFRVNMTGEADLRRVSAQLRGVADGKVMRRELTTGLRQATKPAAASVKAAALALPAHGPRSTGLRRRMAAATSPQIRTGGRNPSAKVRISRARMGDQAGAARGMDRASFRHPVFGGAWVRQRGAPGWFENANKRQAGTVRREMKAVLDRIETILAHR